MRTPLYTASMWTVLLVILSSYTMGATVDKVMSSVHFLDTTTPGIPPPNAAATTPLTLFTVIDEVTSNRTMTNATLDYLVDVIGNKDNHYHKFLPTVLDIDTRTSVLILKKVLLYPDYAIKIIEVLPANPIIARLILKPVFFNASVTTDIFNEVFAYPQVALRLLTLLASNPELRDIAVDGIFKSLDEVLPVLSKYPEVIHQVVAQIGINLQLVDDVLGFLANKTVPSDKLVGLIMTNPESLNPILKEVLNSPVLGNYLFSKFLENKELVQNIETLMFSSPEMVATLENFPINPIIAQKLLGIVLQHPLFTNELVSKILSKPDILVKFISMAVGNTPLKDSFLGKLFIENQPIVSNIIKFVQGRNDSGVTVPPIFIPTLIRKLLYTSKVGKLLEDLHFGRVKTFKQLVATITGIVQNVQGIPNSLFNSVIGIFMGKAVNTSQTGIMAGLVKQVLFNTTLGSFLDSLQSGGNNSLAGILSGLQNVFMHFDEVPAILKSVGMLAAPLVKDDCASDSIYSALGLLNLEDWAMKFIDASGKPERGVLKGNLNFRGNYDECLEIDHLIPGRHKNDGGHLIEGGYCELFYTLPNSFFSKFAGAAADIEGVEHYIRLDLCLPKSCRAKHVNAVVNTTLVNLLGSGLAKVHCIEDKSMKGDTGAYVAIAVFGLLMFLCVIGTLYDVYHRFDKPEDDVIVHNSEKNGHVGPVIALTKFNGSPEDGVVKMGNGDGLVNEEDSDRKDIYSTIDPTQPKSTVDYTPLKYNKVKLNKFLMAFSIRENGRKILDASQPKGSLTCLNGIRVISMAWIIIGHVLTTLNHTLENATEALEYIETFSFQVMLAAPLAVDTFFILSGLLVCYLFVKEIDKVGKLRVRHMALYYFHRIWRLTPLYGLVLLFYTCLSEYVASGPFDVEHPPYRDNCRTYWWRNLLYINTLFKTNEMCMMWSWYLADDMMFYIVSPLAIVPLALGFKVMGFLVIFLMIACHVATYGYFEWFIGSGAQLFNNYRYMDEVYLKPWSRVGVYAIGLALGYIIYKTKFKYRFKRSVLLIGWFLATAAAICIVYITYMEHKTPVVKGQWPIDARTAHETVSRPIWALCLSWVIFTCINGQGGFVNTILSWNFWVPLTKITYGAYLVHLMFIDNVLDSNQRASKYLDIFHVSFEFIGVFAFSYAISFLLSLLIEAPSMALEKIVIRKK